MFHVVPFSSQLQLVNFTSHTGFLKVQTFTNFQRLNVTRPIDQFGHYMYQMKFYLMEYKTYVSFVQKYFVYRELQAVRYSQKHESTLHHMYVINNFWLPTVHLQQNIFEKLLLKLIAHIFALLLAPFASKLINYLRHSESLYIRKNSEIDDLSISKHTSKTHCASNNGPILT